MEAVCHGFRGAEYGHGPHYMYLRVGGGVLFASAPPLYYYYIILIYYNIIIFINN